MNISDNKITEALEEEVEKDISLLFPFIENEVNELALDAMKMAQLRELIDMATAHPKALLEELEQLQLKHSLDYEAALTKYIEKNFDRKEAELQEEAQEERECAAEARADADREERMLERAEQREQDLRGGYDLNDPKHPDFMERFS